MTVDVGSEEWWEKHFPHDDIASTLGSGPWLLNGTPKVIADHIREILEAQPLGTKRGDVQFEYYGHGNEKTGYEGHMLMVNWRVNGKFGIVGP